jgi:hypothetical protein
MSDTPILDLNDTWRVAHDGRLQWILQRRAKNGVWHGNAYCVTQAALLRNIRERCGPVDPAAVKVIEGWHPTYHPMLAAPAAGLGQVAGKREAA